MLAFLFLMFFLFAVLVMIGLVLPLKRIPLVSAILNLFLLFFLIRNKVAPPAIGLYFVTFNLIPLFCKRLTNNFDSKKQEIREKLQEAFTSYDNLSKKQETIKKYNLELEHGLYELSNLYEATKDMNKALHYPELFEIFNQVLRAHFKFSDGYLLLAEKNDDRLLDKRCFILSPAGQVNEPKKNVPGEYKFIDTVLKLVTPEKKEQFLDRAQLSGLLPDTELKSGLNTMVVVVMRWETSTPVVFAGGNLVKDDFEKMLILCRQLGMEIQRVELYEKVQELAITDGLTRVFVRRRLLERLKEELSRSIRYSLRMSVLMLDIDHFKDYNDRYGHLVGDVVLRETAAIIKSSLTEVDLTGRYGGEEFCVVLPETDRKGGIQVAERIRWAVENHSFKAYDEVTNVTLSIGVSVFPEDSMLMEELINNADKALYESKRTGRNRVCDYSQLKL